MSELKRLGGTSYVEHPQWSGNGFTHPEANAYWSELPLLLKKIATREIAAGNQVQQILRNPDRSIVLLAFERGPLTALPAGKPITVHIQHQYGNYCYDGTKCTYEERESGCFLAFDDPDWREDTY